MHQKDIINFLQFVYQRQLKSGPESAFRFNLILNGQRQPVPAKYLRHDQSKNVKSSLKKGKGKAKEIIFDEPQSDASQIAESAESDQIAEPVSIRIDMGTMMKLKEMGCDNVVGPVNGPNDGLPEYEAPKVWIERLNTMKSSANTESANRPRPRPIPRPTVPSNIQIDPALINIGKANDYLQEGNNAKIGVAEDPHINVSPESATRPQPQPISQPTVSANIQMDPVLVNVDHNVQEKDNIGTCLIQRTNDSQDKLSESANFSDHKVFISDSGMETASKKKLRRKVVTNDDLAAMEAQKWLQGNSSRRRRKRGD
jgi:hypothetical protein